MPRLQITVSDALMAEVQALAERDAPGAPNLSATGLRLLALGVAQEKSVRPLVHPPPPRPAPRAVDDCTCGNRGECAACVRTLAEASLKMATKKAGGADEDSEPEGATR